MYITNVLHSLWAGYSITAYCRISSTFLWSTGTGHAWLYDTRLDGLLLSDLIAQCLWQCNSQKTHFSTLWMFKLSHRLEVEHLEFGRANFKAQIPKSVFWHLNTHLRYSSADILTYILILGSIVWKCWLNSQILCWCKFVNYFKRGLLIYTTWGSHRRGLSQHLVPIIHI